MYHKGLSEKESKEVEDDLKKPNSEIRKIIRQYDAPKGHHEITITVTIPPPRCITVSFDKVIR